MTDDPRIAQAATEVLVTDLFDVGGVTYRIIGELTFEHDLYLMALIDEMGLRDPRVLLRPDATQAEQATALLMHVYRTGRTFELLGGLFVPDGVPWSPAVSKETATRLAAATAPAEKAKLMGALSVALLGFFESALASLQTSPAPSGEPAEVDTSAASAGLPVADAAPATSASGTPLSVT